MFSCSAKKRAKRTWAGHKKAGLILVVLIGMACRDGGDGVPGGSGSVAGGMVSSDMAASGKSMEAQGAPVALMSQEERVAPGVIGGRVEPTTPSMIIRTGQAVVEVKSADAAAQAARTLVLKLGGHVTNSQMQGGEHNVKSVTLELKIPAARYDEAVNGLKELGEVESVNTSSEDVGEEYVDIEARVANSKRLEQRLIELLATRTGRLEDVLAVERELARVRETIERSEGRMRYLRTRAAMSTLTVNLHEKAPVLGRSADNPIIEAFKNAWRNFVGFAAGLIASLGVLIPLAVLGILAYFVGLELWKKYRPKSK